jgi:hypothetical protein
MSTSSQKYEVACASRLDALNLTPLQTGEKRNRVSSPTARLGLQNPNAFTGVKSEQNHLYGYATPLGGAHRPITCRSAATITKDKRVALWNGEEGAPRTEAREAGVFMVPLLTEILKNYKKAYLAGKADWIFRGEKLLRPINLDNLSRRDIPQHINGAWFGRQAFRRGQRTRLNEAGVDAKEIQASYAMLTSAQQWPFMFCPITNERKQA